MCVFNRVAICISNVFLFHVCLCVYPREHMCLCECVRACLCVGGCVCVLACVYISARCTGLYKEIGMAAAAAVTLTACLVLSVMVC